MRPEYYQGQWQAIRQSTDTAAIESLAQRVAATFIDRYFYSDEYNARYVYLLCDMATAFSQPELNQIAAKALFEVIIERLCDDFEELQTETYNRLICQVASFLRLLPQGTELDRKLREFNLTSEPQLYQRIEAIRLGQDQLIPINIQPRKIIVLSRVTIGADVAITSIICQRLKKKYPHAELLIIGNDKLPQIFASESGIRICELHYARRGGLIERFNVWLEILQTVNAELSGLTDEEYLLLDPDSRLTQLGALPLVPEHNYRFFNSRGKPGYPIKASISELTNLWLDQILGSADFCFPAVWPGRSTSEKVACLAWKTSAASESRLITLNLGVGGNLRKRVPGEFESDLILSLLQEANTRVLLDLGFGSEERLRSEAILADARNAGFKVEKTSFDELHSVDKATQLIGVECSVAEISALIAHSDEFIGYDSACQHIAAALQIETYTIFAGSNNARFIRRWRACGANVSEIVYVDTISQDGRIHSAEIISRLTDLRRP